MSKQKQTKPTDNEKYPVITEGMLYVAEEDVWAIDFTQSKEYCMVYIRDEVFKVKPENLVVAPRLMMESL